MSYGLVNNIGNMLFQVFGSGIILTAFLLMFLLILMLVMRFPIGAILVILVPLTLGLAIGSRFTNMIALDAWVYVSVLMFVGLVLSTFWFFIFRG